MPYGPPSLPAFALTNDVSSIAHPGQTRGPCRLTTEGNESQLLLLKRHLGNLAEARS